MRGTTGAENSPIAQAIRSSTARWIRTAGPPLFGIKGLERYLVDKIQEGYRSQSVAINDKHIEVLCRQMLPAFV